MGVATLRSAVGDMATPIKNLEVKYEGEWRKFDNLMTYLKGGGFNRGIKRDIAKAQRDFLTGMRRNLVRGLESGGVAIGKTFEGHKAGYKEAGTMGIHSGAYLQALQGSKVIQKGYVVSLSLPKALVSYKPGGKSSYTVGQYALVFEMGNKSGTQVARPLWKQAYLFTGGNKGVHNNMVGAIGKRLNKMGIRIRVKTKKYIK